MLRAIGKGAAPIVWRTLKIGGGGQITRFSVSGDGTIVARTDSAGAFILPAGQTTWRRVDTGTSIPSSYINSISLPWGQYDGVYEIAVAPSDSSIIYMVWNGSTFISTDGGLSFSLTTMPKIVRNSTVSNEGRVTGVDGVYSSSRILVDPEDPYLVYVATLNNGVWRATNGTHFSKVTAIPDAGTVDKGYTLAADISSISGGKAQILYASGWGNEVYQSTDGGANWAAMTGSPTTFWNMKVGPDGVLWFISQLSDFSSGSNTNFYKYNGSWTRFTTTNLNGASEAIQAVAINPSDENKICCTGATGNLIVTTNGGSNWTKNSGNSSNATRSGGDVGWLDGTSFGTFNSFNAYDLEYDAITANRLWIASGVGAWYTTPPAGSASYVWVGVNAGLENMVANSIVSTPSYPDAPLFAFWDRAIFRGNSPDSYPSSQTINEQIVHAWDIDYAGSDPDFIAGLVYKRFPSSDPGSKSGYSTDGGVTWNLFSTAPSAIRLTVTTQTDAGGDTLHFASVPGSVFVGKTVSNLTDGETIGSRTVASVSGNDVILSGTVAGNVEVGDSIFFTKGTFGSGCIAVSTPQNIIIVETGDVAYPVYTKDGGATWSPVVIAGVPTTGTTGWGPGSAYWRRIVAADKVQANTFYLYNHNVSASGGGVYVSTDSGDTWTRKVAGRITSSPGEQEAIRSVPGKLGHVFYNSGNSTSGNTDAFKFSKNLISAAEDAGTFGAVLDHSGAGVTGVGAFGFGAPRVSGGYPTIYIVGRVNGIFGVWRGDDFDDTTLRATWTNLGRWPNGMISGFPVVISGDLSTYGTVYVGERGASIAIGTLPN